MMGIRAMLVGGDDGPVGELLDRLRDISVDVSVVADGAAALRHFGLLEPHLVLIQRPLPGMLDAFETCRALRSRSDAVLVIVPALPGPHDEIIALSVGADHLLPADAPTELALARLRSLVRRAQGMVVLSLGAEVPTTEVRAVRASSGAEAGIRVGADLPQQAPRRVPALTGGAADGDHGALIVDGELEIDLPAREIRIAGRVVDLTRIEFDLLVALASNGRRVITRDQLMESVWQTTFDGSHVLDAHLSRLRCKIAQAGGGRLAHAVRGVGYRLRA